MSESESIPQHLKDSLPSAASYEEGLRRDYQIRVRAWNRGIPQASLANETVHRYVSVFRDLSVVQTRDDLIDPWAVTRRAIPRPREGSQVAGIILQYRLLNRLAEAALTEGVGRKGFYVSDVTTPLDYLLRPLGVRSEVVDDRPEAGYQDSTTREGMWSVGDKDDEPFPDTGMEVSDEAAGKYSGWWNRPDTLVERDDPEHMAAVEDEAQRQGLNPRSQESMDALPSLTRLVYARQLEQEALQLDGLPAAPGLYPSATNRLRRVAPLLTIARRTLEEEFHPGDLEPTELTGVLQPYARQIGREIVSRDG